MISDFNWMKRMLSHNVRMPSAVISGYGELLRQELLTPEEQKKAILDICENIIKTRGGASICKDPGNGGSGEDAVQIIGQGFPDRAVAGACDFTAFDHIPDCDFVPQ